VDHWAFRLGLERGNVEGVVHATLEVHELGKHLFELGQVVRIGSKILYFVGIISEVE
jgi:hypothetical protein